VADDILVNCEATREEKSETTREETDKRETIQELFVKRWYLGIFLVSSLFLPVQAMAAGLVFSDAWARATAPGAGSAAIYGSFRNDGNQPLKIKKITTDVAGMVMLHRSTLDNGMMKMSAVDELSISPGEVVTLEPGGMHMMLMNLRATLEERQIIYVNILTSDEKIIRAEVTVGSVGQMSAPR
jgi:copper(I)-binding protein